MIFFSNFICCSSRAKISASNKLSTNNFPFPVLPTLEKITLRGLEKLCDGLKRNSTGAVMNLSKTILCLLKPIRYRNLSVAVVEPAAKCFAIPVELRTCHKCFCSKSLICENEKSEKSNSVLDPTEPLDLTDYGSAVRRSFKLAAFVDNSPLLQKFLKLGVDLNALDKVRGIQNLILRLNYEKTVKPRLSFLIEDCGVSEEDLGAVITKNPFLFKEDLDDLQVRLNYLKSKKFDKNMISQIIVKQPKWLSIPVKSIDERLGYLQQNLNLKGFQVREIICKAPSLATVQEKKIAVNLFVLKEEMGLDKHSLKKVVMAAPSLLKKDEYDLVRTFEYIKNVMRVPVDLIYQQASVLTCRRFMLEPRHKFLVELGRAQYNPRLPGYISLASFVETDDEEFCEKIAKASIHTYNEFLKTL